MELTKRKKGRPALYNTPEELQAAVDAYFRRCEGVALLNDAGEIVRDRYGRVVMVDKHPPTITGLALACGYSDWHCFTRQKYRSSGFADVVLTARLRVEAYLELSLFDPDTYKGAAFTLRTNFGWGKGTAEDHAGATVRVIIERRPDAAEVSPGTPPVPVFLD